MAILAMLFGSGYLWVKLSLRSFTPIQIAFLQVIIGSLFLFSYIAVRRRLVAIGSGTLLHLCVMAVLSNIVPSLLINWAERSVPSSLGGVTNATTPLFVLLLSLIIGTETT